MVFFVLVWFFVGFIAGGCLVELIELIGFGMRIVWWDLFGFVFEGGCLVYGWCRVLLFWVVLLVLVLVSSVLTRNPLKFYKLSMVYGPSLEI